MSLSPSFLLFGLVLIALGYLEQFFILMIFVTSHEWAHILTGLLISKEPRVNCRHWRITALGQIAVLDNLDYQPPLKKLIIFLAGPLLNLLLGFAIIGRFPEAGNVSLALGIFNLLPVFPLDGGRIAQTLLGDKLGIMAANHLIVKWGRFISRLIMLLGIVQLVLFPFNYSLLALGLFLGHAQNAELAARAAELFRFVTQIKQDGQTKSTRVLTATANTSLLSAYRKIGFTTDITFVTEKGPLTEQAMADYIKEHGLSGTLGEATENKLEYAQKP